MFIVSAELLLGLHTTVRGLTHVKLGLACLGRATVTCAHKPDKPPACCNLIEGYVNGAAILHIRMTSIINMYNIFTYLYIVFFSLVFFWLCSFQGLYLGFWGMS